MTDRELMQQALEALEDACGGRCNAENNPCWQREIADALRDRLAQPEQEPVAWVTGWHDGHCVIRAANPSAILPIGIALYTTPPRREWVGLTDTDIEEVWADENLGRYATSYAIEAKLKEKNA